MIRQSLLSDSLVLLVERTVLHHPHIVIFHRHAEGDGGVLANAARPFRAASTQIA